MSQLAESSGPLRPLLDYLVVRPPLIALVERDPRWARRLLVRSVAALGSGVPCLEWAASKGWSGAPDLLHQCGLVGGNSLRGGSLDPAYHINQFHSWIVTTSQGARSGSDAIFRHGIVALYDLESFLSSPALNRILIEMVDPLAENEATAVLVLANPLPSDHILAPVIVQVRSPIDPMARFGGMVSSFLRQYGGGVADDYVLEIVHLLNGLSLSEADAILRLSALELHRAKGERPAVVDVVQTVRDERLAWLGG